MAIWNQALPKFTVAMRNMHTPGGCGFTQKKFGEISTCSSVARSISCERLCSEDFPLIESAAREPGPA